MLGDGGHAARALVAGVAVLVVLAARVGEAAGPLLGYAGGDPAFDHLLEAVGTDGEELGAVVEDAVVYEVRPHTAADLLFLLGIVTRTPASFRVRAATRPERPAPTIRQDSIL